MRAHRTALLCMVALLIVASDSAFAQKMSGRGGSPNMGMSKPPSVPDGPSKGGGGYPGGGHRGPGWGGVVPGIIVGLPQGSPTGPYIVDDSPPGPRRTQANRRGPSGAPSANERRLVPDEVVVELPNSISAQQIDALQRRLGLTPLESQSFQLLGHDVLSLAHSGPALCRGGRARARNRSHRGVGAAELSVRAAAGWIQKRR